MIVSSVSTLRRKLFVTTKSGLNRSLFSTKNGKDLPPLPSSPSPARAKERYMESKMVTDKYLDPHAKIQQLNRELEIVRENAAAKLEKELNKSLYRKLVDPLKRHKHAGINVGAVTLAYILAHNLFVTSKKEKEARAELSENQASYEDMRLTVVSLLQDSTLKDIGSACARECNKESKDKKLKTSFWRVPVLPSDLEEEEKLERIITKVLEQELQTRIGHLIRLNGEQKQQSIEKIMQENQENVKNQDPTESLLKQALANADNDEIGSTNGSNNNKKQARRVFSM